MNQRGANKKRGREGAGPFLCQTLVRQLSVPSHYSMAQRDGNRYRGRAPRSAGDTQLDAPAVRDGGMVAPWSDRRRFGATLSAKAVAVTHGFDLEALGGSWHERLPGMNVHPVGMPLIHRRPDGSIPMLYTGQGLPHSLLDGYADLKSALTTTPHMPGIGHAGVQRA